MTNAVEPRLWSSRSWSVRVAVLVVCLLCLAKPASAMPPAVEELARTAAKKLKEVRQERATQPDKSRPTGAPNPGPEADAGVQRDAGAGDDVSDGAALGDSPRAFKPATPKPLPDLSGAAGEVVVLPIDGTVELGMAALVERGLKEAAAASVIILDVNTFGGRVDAAVQIRDALLATEVPTVAFVNRRAISAGALISLAADHIVFTSGATMGAATPVQMGQGEMQAVGEKMTSYMRSEMRSTAEAKDRNGDIAEAMVDANVHVVGVSKKGKLLTLTTELALKTGVATAEIESLPELLTALGKPSIPTQQVKENWAEAFVRFITDPTFSGILMSIGTAAILIEIYTAGFGFAGLFGLLCLGLFFGGHMLVGLAGWEEVLLFVVGVAALAAEVFVIPGFGIAGVIGLGAILMSMTMAMLHLPLLDSWQAGTMEPVLWVVLISLLVTVVLLIVAARLLGGKARGGGWLVLNQTLSKDAHAGVAAIERPAQHAELVGLRGTAVTDLRPSGKAKLSGRTYDVVSEMQYVARGAAIEVVEVAGPRIVVNTVEASTEESGVAAKQDAPGASVSREELTE